MSPAPADAGNGRHRPSPRTARRVSARRLRGRPGAARGNHARRWLPGPGLGSPQWAAVVSNRPTPATVRHRLRGHCPGKSRDRQPVRPDRMRETSWPGLPRLRRACRRSGPSPPARPGKPASAPPCRARPRTSTAGALGRDGGLPAALRRGSPMPRRSRRSAARSSTPATARRDRPRHRSRRTNRAAFPIARRSAYPPRSPGGLSPGAGSTSRQLSLLPPSSCNSNTGTPPLPASSKNRLIRPVSIQGMGAASWPGPSRTTANPARQSGNCG